MINKCWITLPVVYSRPFASKTVFCVILNVRRWLFFIIEGQGRKPCFERVPAPGRFPPNLASLRFQTSQHKGQKIHDSSPTFQSKIYPNVVQLERGNQRDGLWLARMNLATHSSRSNTVGFWFSSRASSGPFGWIFDWKVREESWIFWPLCCQVWKRSDAIFWGKIAPALQPFQNKASSLVFLL